MEIENQLLAAVIAVIGVLTPFIRAWVRTKLTPERMADIVEYARIAVRAAEKLGEDVGVDVTGEQKYAFAADALTATAKRLGIRLKKDEVVSFIHAALREMQQVDAAIAQTGPLGYAG